MESIIKQKGDSMRVLKFKEKWDMKKPGLVFNDKVSVDGKLTYWLALDAALEFNIGKRQEYLARQLVNKQKNDMQKDGMQKFFLRHKETGEKITNDRFHWHKSGQLEDRRHNKNNKFILPRPKPKRN